MSHELVAFPNGSFSVKPLRSDEAMHSHIGPRQEAELIYVEQSRLAERLRLAGSPLVVYDLGMGIAANALAAIDSFLESEPRRDMRLVSFEKHLDGLQLALSHAERFPWMRSHRSTLERLLGHRECELQASNGAKLLWQLCEGDFLAQELRPLPPAELVYFDFYSPKACPELWVPGCFEKILAASSERAELFTYGASTAARSAMLLAGWNVGIGLPTGAKKETTVAAARLKDLRDPLGPEWLGKLARSDRPLPANISLRDRGPALDRIRSRPQFLARSPS